MVTVCSRFIHHDHEIDNRLAGKYAVSASVSVPVPVSVSVSVSVSVCVCVCVCVCVWRLLLPPLVPVHSLSSAKKKLKKNEEREKK